jgi:hypothetical protein
MQLIEVDRLKAQAPIIWSETPPTYTSAVSTRLPPASTYASRIAKASASGVSEPKYMVPRAIFDTEIPVFPSLRFNMAKPFIECRS